MKKKYLLLGYAVIATCVISILIAITLTSVVGMKGARNHMANPENRMHIYENAAKVSRDTGLDIPDFRVYEHKPGEYHDGGLFRDTLIVFFYKGIPEKTFKSFEERAKSLANSTDSCKSVEIDSLTYQYQDFYVGGFSCYVGIQISRNSQYGRLIYGNWRKAQE